MEEGAMAKELLPDAFWARIAPLFVLKTGIPWEYLPAEMGCWERDDVLAQAARLVPSGRLAQAAPGASRRAGPGRSHRLGPGRAGLRRGAGPGGAKKRARTQRIAANRARSAILWSTPTASRSRSW